MEKEQLVSLVAAAQNGDSQAQSELFSAFYNDVYYFALKTVKDEDLACDITQEAFIEIINTIGNLKEPAAFVTWMKQITYHQCTRYFKKKKDVIVTEDEDGGTIFDDLKEESAEFIPDEALDRDEFKKTILAILDELSEEQRSAVMMYYFDELSVREIAEIQGVSEGTVKSRLNYARKAIKASVEEYEKKNGIKLHAFPFLPFLRRLLADGAKTMSASKAAAVAEGVSAATGTAVTVTAAATTATATVAAAAATGITAKIVAGIIAATVIIGGTTAAVVLTNRDDPADSSSLTADTSAVYDEPLDNIAAFDGMPDMYSYNEAFLQYTSQIDPHFYDLPYFSSPDELPVNTAIRFVYGFWGGTDADGAFVDEIDLSRLNNYLEYVFDFRAKPEEIDGQYAALDKTTGVVRMTFDNPYNTDHEYLSGYTAPVNIGTNTWKSTFYYGRSIDPDDASFSYDDCAYIANGGYWIKYGFHGTLTIEMREGRWVFASFTDEKLTDDVPSTPDDVPSTPSDDGGIPLDFVVPDGATYTAVSGEVFKSGQTVTVYAHNGDKLVTEDYTYMVGGFYEYYPAEPDVGEPAQDVGWKMNTTYSSMWTPRVNDMTKTAYEPLLDEINNLPVGSIVHTFAGCENMLYSPAIPDSVIYSGWTYADCFAMKEAPVLPPRLEFATNLFRNCRSITAPPVLPESLIGLTQTFSGCSSLKTAPVIPQGVTEMYGTFSDCTSLTAAPVIPGSVTWMNVAFSGCTSLTGTIEIHATPYPDDNGEDNLGGCFEGTVLPITLTGSSSLLNELAATANNGNVTVAQ